MNFSFQIENETFHFMTTYFYNGNISNKPRWVVKREGADRALLVLDSETSGYGFRERKYKQLYEQAIQKFKKLIILS